MLNKYGPLTLPSPVVPLLTSFHVLAQASIIMTLFWRQTTPTYIGIR